MAAVGWTRWLLDAPGADPRIGNARWVLGRRGLLMPLWWAGPIMLQLPALPTVAFCVYSPARHYRWMTAGAWGLLAATWGMQLAASCFDPGIVLSSDDAAADAAAEWCASCRLYRPCRAGHCPTLERCVEEYDHFCPVIGACVGRRTMRYFIGFLSGCSGLAAWVGGCCWWLIRPGGACAAGGRYVHDVKGVDNLCGAASVGVGAGVWAFGMAVLYCWLLCTDVTLREAERAIAGAPAPPPGGRGGGGVCGGLRAGWRTLWRQVIWGAPDAPALAPIHGGAGG